jgi:virginiamycin B lyase
VRAPPAAHEPWVTEFNDGVTTNLGAWGITAAGGNLWFTGDASNAFTRITPSAVLTEFPDALLSGGPRGIAEGLDGNIWIAEARRGRRHRPGHAGRDRH